jgi:hypothetical protein
MADVGEFAQKAADLFLESQLGMPGRYNLGLPRQAVEEFVKAVFFASMVPDEGRYPSVCLMSYRMDDEREFHFPFCTPSAPTAAEIAKLAHAVSPGGHLYCLCDKGKLQITGIHVAMLDELRQFGYSSFRVANPLKLLIRGPGHIEVSIGSDALIFRAGDILPEHPLQHADVMAALAASVAAELAGQTNGTIDSLEDIFNDLAEAIVKLGHGGLLLVTRCPVMSQFSSARPIDCQLLRQLLIRYWNDVAARKPAANSAANVPGGQYQKTTNRRSVTVASDTTMLENCVRSIAHLAGMDGAIVMDCACNVVAFNAIIARSAEQTCQAVLVDQTGRPLSPAEVGRNQGSRHQAAMCYALRVPHSFAFVISQDGSVSAFHNRADGTVRYEWGLRVLD